VVRGAATARHRHHWYRLAIMRLRGSNAYKGFSMLHRSIIPISQTIRTARALFADDPTPLDERIILEPEPLTDALERLGIQVPTAADSRIAAFWKRSEAEMNGRFARPPLSIRGQITIPGELAAADFPTSSVRHELATEQSGRSVRRSTGACSDSSSLDRWQAVLDDPYRRSLV